MQAEWSLILNVILLVGVCWAILHTLRGQRSNRKREYQPQPSRRERVRQESDDIVAVRKIPAEPEIERDLPKIKPMASETEEPTQQVHREASQETIVMFLLAKEKDELAGYELLQTLLAAGLRFGEGHLFHRHQKPNGQGPVLCSLAAATPSGMFDLQNIGAFKVKGLCMFMQVSGNPMIDKERFTIMYETAKQLCEDLDTHLLDGKKRPLDDTSLAQYLERLNIVGEPGLA